MRNGKILVRVNEDRFGNLLVEPVCQEDRDYVTASNEYDHHCDIYLQNSQDIQEFLEYYPKARFRIPKSSCDIYGGYIIGRYAYCVNDNNKFYIDEWEFRHMVGGQSD